MAKAPSGKNGNRTTARKTRPITEGASKRPTSAAAVAVMSDGDLEERIRQRAYELYEQEGRQDGRDQEYWLRAEAELRGRRSA